MRTDLYKFSIGDASVDLAATGQVPGWVLNSFSMDEEGAQFRIATTSSSSDGTSNNVFVLAEQGDELTITGGVTGLAFTERLYSARFIGDRGYLVTFRPVDPLFTLDLSDPASPQVLGELKIPGFSSYLHPIEGDLLIGVGRDVDETTNRAKGVQVSVFDVSDPANPTRIDVETFGEDWATTSDIDHDHHAFAWFGAQQTLALPITRYTDDWPRSTLESSTELLRADRATGLTPLGHVSHTGEALRNVRIGQHLYSIAADAIKIVPLGDPDDVLKVIESRFSRSRSRHLTAIG